MRRLAAIVRSARRSFRGSLELRLAFVVLVATLAGAAAGLLPAVIGLAVSVVTGAPARSGSGFFGGVVSALPSHRGWVVVLAAAATALVVGVSVLSTKLASALSGELTAALRIELVRAITSSSPREAFGVASAVTGPTRPPGLAAPPPGARPRGPGAPPGGEGSGPASVQLAVSRESGVVGEFVVSVATSLPQALATMSVLVVELVSGDAWAVLLGGLVLFVVSRVLADRASSGVADARRELQAADVALFASLQELLGALEDVRLWGARESILGEFSEKSRACAEARRQFAVAMASAAQVRSVFTAMSPLLVVVALELGGRAFGAGEVAKLMLFVPLLLGRLDVLDGVRQGLVERGPVVEATQRLLELAPAPARHPDARRLESGALRGELVFEDVSFTPPGASAPVVDGVSFRVPAGAVVAVCGASGSGKSTLLRLALRLDDPTEGRVLLDGVDVRQLETAQLSEFFGVVRQTAQPLERTIRANLSLGLEPPPDETAMREALASVELHDLASADGLRGLDMKVKRDPPNLSGGEMRRLLLARMLLGRAPVRLLDEPEAGLPSATAEGLLDALVRASDGRTTLVATHAPHLLRSEFNVLLDGGKVIAQGTHDELSRSSEPYRALLADALKR